MKLPRTKKLTLSERASRQDILRTPIQPPTPPEPKDVRRRDGRGLGYQEEGVADSTCQDPSGMLARVCEKRLGKSLPRNPYLEIFLRLRESPAFRGEVRARRLWRWRRKLVRVFSWAIPSEEVLEVIAKSSPIVEIGAGGGYWSQMIRARGGVVDAYDISLKRGVGVKMGDADAANKYGKEWALLLCWPPMRGVMASQALGAFRGNSLFYIGEAEGGCTGDDRFHRALASSWECTERREMLRWDGIHDEMFMFRRKKTGGGRGRVPLDE